MKRNDERTHFCGQSDFPNALATAAPRVNGMQPSDRTTLESVKHHLHYAQWICVTPLTAPINKK